MLAVFCAKIQVSTRDARDALRPGTFSRTLGKQTEDSSHVVAEQLLASEKGQLPRLETGLL
jgi:hypothetical protein